MGRLGRPDELNGLAVFLASEASGFVTGAEILVDVSLFPFSLLYLSLSLSLLLLLLLLMDEWLGCFLRDGSEKEGEKGEDLG